MLHRLVDPDSLLHAVQQSVHAAAEPSAHSTSRPLQLVVVHALLEAEELDGGRENVVLRVLILSPHIMEYRRQVGLARAHCGGHAAWNCDVAFPDVEIEVEQRFATSNLDGRQATGLRRIPQAFVQQKRCHRTEGPKSVPRIERRRTFKREELCAQYGEKPFLSRLVTIIQERKYGSTFWWTSTQ